MKEKFIKINNLSVDKILADFINNELLLGTNISPKKFWDGFDKWYMNSLQKIESF